MLPLRAAKPALAAAMAPPATVAAPPPLTTPFQLTPANNGQMTALEPNQLAKNPGKNPLFSGNYFEPLSRSTDSTTWPHRPSTPETPLLPAATAPTGTDEAVAAGPDPTVQQRERCAVGQPGQGITGHPSDEAGSGSIFSLSALYPKPSQQQLGKRQRPSTPGSPNSSIHAPPSAEKLLQHALWLTQQAWIMEQDPATETAVSAIQAALGYNPNPNSNLNPSRSSTIEQAKLSNLEQKVDQIIQAFEQLKPTYAEIAKSVASQVSPNQPATPPSSRPSGLKSVSFTSPAVSAKWSPVNSTRPRPKSTASTNITKKSGEPEQVTIITTATEELKFDPMQLRDTVNHQLQTIMVAKISASKNHNFVITLRPGNSATEFISKKSVWQQAFEAYGIEKVEQPTTWLKLIAHGIPTRAFTNNLPLFKSEVETFNEVKIIGSPRWLKEPTGKLAGSVKFAVATEEEKHICLAGLTIAGISVKVETEKAFTNSTQCYRCQGFGHNPKTCKNKAKCRLCGENHHTYGHKCNKCDSTTECEHLQVKCSNCGGNHKANDRSCEVVRAIRSKSTQVTSPQTQSRLPQAQPSLPRAQPSLPRLEVVIPVSSQSILRNRNQETE